MVQNVERFCSELQSQPVIKLELLPRGCIELGLIKASDKVSGCVSGIRPHGYRERCFVDGLSSGIRLSSQVDGSARREIQATVVLAPRRWVRHQTSLEGQRK